jgi:hypothetical protein
MRGLGFDPVGTNFQFHVSRTNVGELALGMGAREGYHEKYGIGQSIERCGATVLRMSSY